MKAFFRPWLWLVLLLPVISHAETTPESIETQSEEEPDRRFFAVPVPVSDNTLGSGLGLNAFYLHDRPDEETAPSTSMLFAQYTSTDSYFVVGGHEHIWKGDQWRGNIYAGVYRMNLKHYGYNELDSANWPVPLPYANDGAFVYSSLKKRIVGDFFLGGQFVGFATQATGEKGQYPDEQVKQFEDQQEGASAGFGLLAQYDTRDNLISATEGVNLEASTLHYRKALGSVKDYDRVELKGTHYNTLKQDHVLATKFGMETLFGDVPAFANVGVDVRGIRFDRFQGRHALNFEAEYRWTFQPRWTAAGFVGGGVVAQEFHELPESKFYPTVGAGIRYMLQEEERVQLGIDYAVSESGGSFYIRIGESF